MGMVKKILTKTLDSQNRKTYGSEKKNTLMVVKFE